jgi:hypothetical protein
MEAVLAIDHELGLGAYEDAVFERRVREFPARGRPGYLGGDAQHATRTANRHQRGPAAQHHRTAAVPARNEATRRLPDLLTRLVPTAVVEVWDGMGHFLHLIDSTRFAARLADLLR